MRRSKRPGPSASQQSLALGKTPRRPKAKATHGGRREGAGRPRKHPLPEGWKPSRRFVPHVRRGRIDARRPAHVTMRLLPVAHTLRNGKLYARAGGRTVRGKLTFTRPASWGTYRAKVKRVNAAGLRWNGKTPQNRFVRPLRR